jgi:radical SAM-linked protein
VSAPLHYASHLDRMRVWERAARRAGLPLAYSAGFTPRPRLQIAAALPVGFTAQEELLDFWLTRPVSPEKAHAALDRALPEGLAVLRVTWADPTDPPLPTGVQAAEYRVVVETALPAVEVRRRVGELLAAESLPRQRRGRAYDLRPLIEQLAVEEELVGEVVLGMLLAARQGATGRPEEVLDGLGLADGFFRVQRQRLLLGV